MRPPRIRPLRFALAVLLLAIVSFSVTLALRNRSEKLRRAAERIDVGMSADNDQVRVVSATDLIRKADAPTRSDADDSASTTAPLARARLLREVVVRPEPASVAMRVELARAVSPVADFSHPVWSPVGLDVAFTRRTGDGLFLAGTNDRDIRVLSDDPGAGLNFDWNFDGMSLNVRGPDGRFADLLITGEKYPAAERLRRVFERDGIIYYQPNEGEPVRLSGSQDRFQSPRISPNQERVVFEGRDTGLYITTIEPGPLIAIGRGRSPSWLPDSSGIIFDLPIDDGATVIDGDLWYVSADGQERANITRTPGIVESHGSVSPEGERIAFASEGAIYVGNLMKGSAATPSEPAASRAPTE